ncbi:hypothetical protein [Fodinibius sediminis]|uniref:Outer membrane protein beta-barrel domain-containing protein n=1 Tax=Fodinibius sediminis TaxID=1214077 RepID=A0A521AB90_9BACT|nr:hypothetical protein [Fodinibius sediminis]SMO32067.1 hypothetical protein SAMN06265218_10123 [Fodinibius sediminis]
MMKNYSARYSIDALLLAVGILLFSAGSLHAQTTDSAIKPLRSDVGINGLTANFHWLSNFTQLDDDTLRSDGSSELEFVFRDIRMMTPRLGVGFQVLGSFFIDNSGDNTSFGVGSWGLGPVFRAYPFKTNRFQPYVQGNALFGNNLAVGTMANSRTGGNGFRVRLGLRGGVAYRINNSIGFFVEAGPDWESGRLFKADARNMQINIGIDVYRFN